MEEVELKQYILDYSKSIAKGDDDVLEIAGRVSDFIEGKEDKCKNCTLVQWLWLILYLNVDVLLGKDDQEDEQPHQRLLEYVDKEATVLPRFVRRKMCKRIKKYIEE